MIAATEQVTTETPSCDCPDFPFLHIEHPDRPLEAGVAPLWRVTAHGTVSPAASCALTFTGSGAGRTAVCAGTLGGSADGALARERRTAPEGRTSAVSPAATYDDPSSVTARHDDEPSSDAFSTLPVTNGHAGPTSNTETPMLVRDVAVRTRKLRESDVPEPYPGYWRAYSKAVEDEERRLRGEVGNVRYLPQPRRAPCRVQSRRSPRRVRARGRVRARAPTRRRRKADDDEVSKRRRSSNPESFFPAVRGIARGTRTQ